MQVGALISGLQAALPTTGLVHIPAGKYLAGGMDTEKRFITVVSDFLTPPGEVTNAQAQAVIEKYGDRPYGLFLTERPLGYRYLYATGRDTDVQKFETIDPKFLPPHLGIGESFEELLANPVARANVDLGPIHDPDALAKAVKSIFPSADRYKWIIKDQPIFADDHAAITYITAWQAQAVAQLLGDPEIADQLFGLGKLGGSYYADLLTVDQWGLMAMEGILEFMTSTGQLTSQNGQKLRAFGLRHIVRATDYPALPNGVLPNTTFNWVKDFIEQGGLQLVRGGQWFTSLPALLHIATRGPQRPDEENSKTIGLRVGYFSRTP